MNAYEQIINTMRQQGSVNNPATLQIAEMVSATTCMVGDLKLEKDDYIIAEHLTEHEIEIDVEKAGTLTAKTNTVLEHSHNITSITTEKSKIKVHSALKKGDVVLVQRLSDELYAIIERLVEL